MIVPICFRSRGATPRDLIALALPDDVAAGVDPKRRPYLSRKGERIRLLMNVLPGTPHAHEAHGRHYVAAEGDTAGLRLVAGSPPWADEPDEPGEVGYAPEPWAAVALYGAPTPIAVGV